MKNNGCVTITISINDKLLQRLNEILDCNCMSRSKYICRLITDDLDRMDREDQEENNVL